MLSTQHTQILPASTSVQTLQIGQKGDALRAQVHFWTQPSSLNLALLATQQQWKTQLQFNGRHSAFVTDRYLHSASVDDSIADNMSGAYFNHGHCGPHNPAGSLRGLMSVDCGPQSQEDRLFTASVKELVEGKNLSIEGLNRLNFLIGRAYCSDQSQDGL